MTPPPPPGARRRMFSSAPTRRARARLLIAAGLGAALAALPVLPGGWQVRVLAGWNASALLILASSWRMILRASPALTRRRAGAEDPGRGAVLLVVALASTVGLIGAVVIGTQARGLRPTSEALVVALAILAVLTAWLLTQTSFTLHYAHLYYKDDGSPGGLEFPGCAPAGPDDRDFAYFAFTVGMTFQVSDVVVSSSEMRRVVLAHALLAFVFNTVVLAFALNLVFGLLASGA